jgi:hypothetical protein
MAELSIFDQWLADNDVEINWKLNRLRAAGVDGHVTDDTVLFYSEATTDLATFLSGKMFRLGTWEEIPQIPVTPTPDVVHVDPTPFTPDQVVTPDVPVTPDTPATPQKRTRRPSAVHVDVPAVDPNAAPVDTTVPVDNTKVDPNVTSPTVPTEPQDGTAPAAS